MRDIMNRFSINCHSSIRCGGDSMALWFDPFRVENTPGDEDVIFVTHEHYDHFSPEDIRRVMKPDGVIVLPESCQEAALANAIRPQVAVPTHYGSIVGEMADGDTFAAALDGGIRCVKLL